MIDESVIYRNNFLIFTTLVGRKVNFLKLIEYIKTIKEIKVVETTEFLQGKLIRWGLSWSFYSDLDDFFENNPLIENHRNLLYNEEKKMKLNKNIWVRNSNKKNKFNSHL